MFEVGILLHQLINFIDPLFDEFPLFFLEFASVDLLNVLLVLHEIFLHGGVLDSFELVFAHANLQLGFLQEAFQLGDLVVLLVKLLFYYRGTVIPSSQRGSDIVLATTLNLVLQLLLG